MKKFFFGLFLLVFAGSAILLSCKKENLTITDHISDPPPFVPDRDYFWGQPWQKTSTGYEMKLQASRLTDSAINKGIRVGLAIYSDWSNFETLPFTINDPSWLRDTINLSYTVTPGKLQIFAKTTVDITWSSDVFIQY
jgi:hypothetical protein